MERITAQDELNYMTEQEWEYACEVMQRMIKRANLERPIRIVETRELWVSSDPCD